MNYDLKYVLKYQHFLKKVQKFHFLFFQFLLFTLKSATAAEKIATSDGRFFKVSSNISSADLTLIKFILLAGFKFVGPDIKVVSKPFSTEILQFLLSLPLDLFEINLTGSICSWWVLL